ncbi:MAG: hypothetical protein Q8R32_03530 [bacterium]|nr:hypothetical protein [bacterium]
MQRLPTRVAGVLLFIGAVAAAVTLLGVSTTALAVSPRWRGTLIGALVGLYGLLLFNFGYLRGVRRPRPRVPSETDQERPGPSPDEAKFWLKKFLAEQQKK